MSSLNIKLVIFDMDGTIFDTERLGIDCWKRAFKELNIEVPEDVLLLKIGLNSKDSKALMKSVLGENFDYNEVKELKRKFTFDYIAQFGTPLKKGLNRLLLHLSKLGIKKVVATSRSKKNTEYYFSKSNLVLPFDNIVTGDMVDKGKPSPDIFLHAAGIMNVEPCSTMVVEDSFNGIEAAYNANMLPVMIPDLLFPNDDIKKMLYAKCETLDGIIQLL